MWAEGLWRRCGRSRWNGWQHKNPFKAVKKKKKSTESLVRQIKGGRGACTVIGKCYFSVSHAAVFSYPVSLLSFWTWGVQMRSKPITGLEIKTFCWRTAMTTLTITRHNKSQKQQSKNVKTYLFLFSLDPDNRGVFKLSGCSSQWILGK